MMAGFGSVEGARTLGNRHDARSTPRWTCSGVMRSPADKGWRLAFFLEEADFHLL